MHPRATHTCLRVCVSTKRALQHARHAQPELTLNAPRPIPVCVYEFGNACSRVCALMCVCVEVLLQLLQLLRVCVYAP